MFWVMFYDWWLNTCCYDFGVPQTEVTDDMMEVCSTVDGHYTNYFEKFSLVETIEL